MQNAVLELYAPTVHTELQNLHLRHYLELLAIGMFHYLPQYLPLPTSSATWMDSVTASLFL